MEPVSLALGIVGSFQICAEGYQFITSIKHASSDAARIQCKCEIEEARFLLWGKSWGLVDESGALVIASNVQSKLIKEPVAMSRLVAKILSEIETILGTTGVLKSKYGIFGSVGPEHRTDDSYHAGSMNLKRRITWSARDKESFQALVRELRDLNSGLYSLLPTKSQTLLSEALNTEILLARKAPKDLETVKEVSEQENPALKGAAELKSLGIEADSTDVSWNILPSAKLPKAWFRFSSLPDTLDTCRNPVARTVSCAFYSPNGSGDPFPVMIEWRSYDPHAVGSRAFILALRADGLCRLLHKFSTTALGVLPCLGFFDDVAVARFGIAFQLPKVPLYEKASQPITLNAIIHSHPRLPPLEDRLRLAATLARTIFAFHCSDWLHKDFSSHNILLGTSPENSSVADLTRPYVIGFKYSRPDDPEGLSSQIQQTSLDEHLLYQHPYLLVQAGQDTPRYCKTFDLWALGCVLLEIGLWRRLLDIWKPKYAEDRVKWADRLRNGWVEELHGRCGGIYRDVVKACLVSPEEVAKSPGQLFWDIVVKLESIQV
jgi:hypothetical protein